MRLSQIAQNVAVDILAGVDYEIVELLVRTYDMSVGPDGIDEIYEMIPEGDVFF
jgi:hypothetical protein